MPPPEEVVVNTDSDDELNPNVANDQQSLPAFDLQQPEGPPTSAEEQIFTQTGNSTTDGFSTSKEPEEGDRESAKNTVGSKSTEKNHSQDESSTSAASLG